MRQLYLSISGLHGFSEQAFSNDEPLIRLTSQSAFCRHLSRQPTFNTHAPELCGEAVRQFQGMKAENSRE